MTPFLRIPPFPAARHAPLAIGRATRPLSEAQCSDLVELLRAERVGGDFWCPARDMPGGRDILLAPADPHQAEQMVAAAMVEEIQDRCLLISNTGIEPRIAGQHLPIIEGPFDPWQLIGATQQLWVDANQELALIAALQGKALRTFGNGIFASLSSDSQALAASVAATVGSFDYASPFDGSDMTAAEAVGLLAEWRKLIDGNQQIAGAIGIAAWKRPTLDPLLWDGGTGPAYAKRPPPFSGGAGRLAVWKSRTTPAVLREIERDRREIAEVEDGMIRGQGLGANCIPPLSIVLDYSGIYFDPSQVSDLETLLQSADFGPELLDRAAKLRRQIVDAGISKYGGDSTERIIRSKVRRVLIVGQVEDDRSILSGGKGQTNLELLQRARSMEPDAWLVYRPHPDVEAGHRKGHVPDDVMLQFADEIDRGGSIIDLIDNVDELHCITSLAGFEALLREKPVTTHGVPFYAGWGLTRDLGEIPDRRTRRRSLDELIAASLILYPRYLDPLTGLPCPAEVLVERIARGEGGIAAPLAGFRKMQGRIKRAVRRVREAVA